MKKLSVLIVLFVLVISMAFAQSVKINWIEPSADVNKTNATVISNESVSNVTAANVTIKTAAKNVTVEENATTESEDSISEISSDEVVEDGGMSIADDISPAPQNTAPVFYSIDSVTVYEGTEVYVELFAYDADSNKLSFSSSNLPQNATLKGSIFRWNVPYDTVNGCWYWWLMRCRTKVRVDFNVSDGLAQSSKSLFVTVLDDTPKEVIAETNETEVTENASKDLNMSIANEVKSTDNESEASENKSEAPKVSIANESEASISEEVKNDVSEDNVTKVVVNDSEDLNIDEIIPEENLSVEEVDDNESISAGLDEIINVTEVPSSATAAVIKEGEELGLTLDVIDPDNDNLTFKVKQDITGAYFIGNEFRWVPPFETVAKKSCWYYWIMPCSKDVPLTFTASDGVNEVTQDFIVKVMDNNAPPVINKIDDIAVNETDAVNITPIVYDADGDKIKVKFSEPLDKNGYWMPGEGNTGIFNATVTASDGRLSDSKTFAIKVLAVESKPVIESYYPEEDFVNMTEGENLTFNVSVSDADSDNLTYVWKLNDKIGSMKDYMTLLTNTKSAGSYFVSVDVSDSKNTVSVVWKVNVDNLNMPPVLENIEDITVNEGDVVSIVLNASDPDGDMLKYKISEPIGEDGIWKTAKGDSGEYDVDVEVSDGVNSVNDTFKVTVNHVNTGSPVIESYSPKNSTLSMVAGEDMTFEVDAKDPDNDELSYEWYFNEEKVSEKSSFIFNSKEDDKGAYDVSVTVSDGNFSTSMKWQITVMIPNRPPVLDVNDMTVKEGELVNLSLAESDEDGDYIVYNISAPLSSKGIWQTTNNDSGVYDINITASDGTFVVEKSIVLTVLDVNNPPVFEPIDDITVNEGKELAFDVKVSDEDGDKIILSASDLPEGAVFEDSKFMWTPGFDAVKRDKSIISSISSGIVSDDFTVKFTADDGSNEVMYDVKITVVNVNHAPKIESIDEVVVNEGDTFKVTPEVSDKDSDELTVKFSGWMDSDTKTAGYDDAGSHLVTATVSDGIAEDSEGFVVTVINKNQPPSFRNISTDQNKMVIKIKSGSEQSWLEQLFGW